MCFAPNRFLAMLMGVSPISPCRLYDTLWECPPLRVSTSLWVPSQLAKGQSKPSVIGVSLAQSLCHTDGSVPN